MGKAIAQAIGIDVCAMVGKYNPIVLHSMFEFLVDWGNFQGNFQGRFRDASGTGHLFYACERACKDTKKKKDLIADQPEVKMSTDVAGI